MSDILTRQNFIQDANGNILLTIEQDQTDIAKSVGIIKEETKGWSTDRTMKMSFSVPAQEYYEWGEKLGFECWEQDDFLKFYAKRRPEFRI